jgi:hypothetical protein
MIPWLAWFAAAACWSRAETATLDLKEVRNDNRFEVERYRRALSPSPLGERM